MGGGIPGNFVILALQIIGGRRSELYRSVQIAEADYLVPK